MSKANEIIDAIGKPIVILLVYWRLGRTPLCAIALRASVAGALVAGTMDKIAEISLGQALYTHNPHMKGCLFIIYLTLTILFFFNC